jgi:hypothetical protein
MADNPSATPRAAAVRSGARRLGAKRRVRARTARAANAARRRPVSRTPSIPGGRRATPTTSKSNASAGANKPTAGASAFKNLGQILTPKNFDDSMSTINNLRNFCRQAGKYVQQADTLLETLFATGTSLKESGVLKKLAETKGKNLSTGDLTNILLSLMNTPIGANLLRRGSSGDADSSAKPTQDN